MKRVPTLDHNPVPNSRNLISPIWTPFLKNATSATDPYSTNLTPYACTCRDSMHMRKMLHLATLVLFTDRFVISPLVLSTLCSVVSTLYILYATIGPCSVVENSGDIHKHTEKLFDKLIL